MARPHRPEGTSIRRRSARSSSFLARHVLRGDEFYLITERSRRSSPRSFSRAEPAGLCIFALMAFAAGVAVRPFRRIFVGRIGYLGRAQVPFLITILIMPSTFVVRPAAGLWLDRHRGAGDPIAIRLFKACSRG